MSVENQDFEITFDKGILFSPSFIIKSIKFGMKLLSTEDNTLLFMIKLTHGLPSEITELTAKIALYCEQTDAIHTQFTIFNDQNDFVDWPWYALYCR